MPGPEASLVTNGSSPRSKKDLKKDLAELQEFDLLGATSEKPVDTSGHHEMLTAPLLTRGAFVLAKKQNVKMQYGVLGGPHSRPSEVAWLASSSRAGVRPPSIKVYVSPSSLRTMRAVYGAIGGNIIVEPLLFEEAELDAHAFLGMMCVSMSEAPPLYVQTMLSILRELGEDYTYQKFKETLNVKKKNWNRAQLSGLQQRLALLESFLAKNSRSAKSSRFAAGQITIVDLSDPFIDAGSACGLFEIITRLFVRADVKTGKVLVVDEAHKYLADNESAAGLTGTLLELTREQRHLAMRVIISTQEPTIIPPTVFDLCTIAIMHRFSSPTWWKALSAHVSADISSDEAFDKVLRLQVMCIAGTLAIRY
ncbi:hypothetical protein HWV62_32760 [Athelia sp. TMB]|nr:hypothetical protein HWV62_32760 [Athelia sp. TMB]